MATSLRRWNLKRRLRREPRVNPCDVRDTISNGLGRIVEKCLMKDRDRRYQTVQQLITDLEAWKTRGTITVTIPWSRMAKSISIASSFVLLTTACVCLAFWLRPPKETIVEKETFVEKIVEVNSMPPVGKVHCHLPTEPKANSICCFRIDPRTNQPILDSRVDFDKNGVATLDEGFYYLFVVYISNERWLEVVRFVPTKNSFIITDPALNFHRLSDYSIKLQKVFIPHEEFPLSFSMSGKFTIIDGWYVSKTAVDLATFKNDGIGKEAFREDNKIFFRKFEKGGRLNYNKAMANCEYEGFQIAPYHIIMTGLQRKLISPPVKSMEWTATSISISMRESGYGKEPESLKGIVAGKHLLIGSGPIEPDRPIKPFEKGIFSMDGRAYEYEDDLKDELKGRTAMRLHSMGGITYRFARRLEPFGGFPK